MTLIDVSRHQGAIEWPRLRAEGRVECAIIRATLGANGIDDRFATNWRESGWAGVPRRGIYHYVITGLPAAAQLRNILAVTGGDFGTEPIVVDVERTKGEREAMLAGWRFPRPAYTAMLYDLCFGLLNETPVRIYTNKWEWLAMTTQPLWAQTFELHVAGYPDDPASTTYKPAVPAPWADWAMWQFSSTGRLPGIAGNVDLNRERVASPVPPAPALTPAEHQIIADVGGQVRAAVDTLSRIV